MAALHLLKQDSEDIFPVTHADAVIDLNTLGPISASYITKSSLATTTGSNTDLAMSQAAVTTAISGLPSYDFVESYYVSISSLLQETGSNADRVMSQDAVTRALSGKVDTVSGYGLSQENFTSYYKSKLEQLIDIEELDDLSDVIIS